MRVYGHSYRDTMQLPMRAFWNISGAVPRLLAGERKDTLELLTTSAHNPEATRGLFMSLQDISPEPVVMTGKAILKATSIADKGAADRLRALAG